MNTQIAFFAVLLVFIALLLPFELHTNGVATKVVTAKSKVSLQDGTQLEQPIKIGATSTSKTISKPTTESANGAASGSGSSSTQASQPVVATEELYFYMGNQRVAALQVPTQTMYLYHNDHLGSPRVITSESGSVVWTSDYTLFGQSLRETDVNSADNFRNDFKFAGKLADLPDLHYSGARYYSPSLGAFLQADPILRATSSNYVYANNNPLIYVDPSGMLEQSIQDSRPPPEVFGHRLNYGISKPKHETRSSYLNMPSSLNSNLDLPGATQTVTLPGLANTVREETSSETTAAGYVNLGSEKFGVSLGASYSGWTHSVNHQENYLTSKVSIEGVGDQVVTQASGVQERSEYSVITPEVGINTGRQIGGAFVSATASIGKPITTYNEYVKSAPQSFIMAPFDPDLNDGTQHQIKPQNIRTAGNGNQWSPQDGAVGKIGIQAGTSNGFTIGAMSNVGTGVKPSYVVSLNMVY